MKKTKILCILSVLLLVGVVTGALINYFGRVETNITIKQSITIDHKSYDKPIVHNINLHSGDTKVFQHTIYNEANMCNVCINQSTIGLCDGLTLRIKHNGTVLQFPIELYHQSSILLDFEYHADINLKPKHYKVRTTFTVDEL